LITWLHNLSKSLKPEIDARVDEVDASLVVVANVGMVATVVSGLGAGPGACAGAWASMQAVTAVTAVTARP